jgi:hypothetical protein
MKQYILSIVLLISVIAVAQTEKTELPYYEIPENSENFTAGTVAARQVDGLGFRFYWATEGLTEKDLTYKPNEDVRTTGETVKHIYELSIIVLNSTLNKANTNEKEDDLSFKTMRERTLHNLKQAADTLRASDDISKFKIIFGTNEIPFWNNINGPIADAIWHSGQIASYRRTSGNAISSKVNHFWGKVKK